MAGRAATALLRARLMLASSSPKLVMARLQAHNGPPGNEHAAEADRAWLRDAAWAIQGMAPRLPWRTDCLVRVLAAERLVRRRGLVPRINFQAGRDAAGRFEAHAWLQCGGIAISGGPAPHLADLSAPDSLSVSAFD